MSGPAAGYDFGLTPAGTRGKYDSPFPAGSSCRAQESGIVNTEGSGDGGSYRVGTSLIEFQGKLGKPVWMEERAG